VEPGRLQALADEFVDVTAQRLVRFGGDAVEPANPRAIDQPDIAGEALLPGELGERIERGPDDARAERLREVDDDRGARRPLRDRCLGPDLLDCLPDCRRPRRDVGLVGLRAGDGEHQRGRVAEVANECDRAGAVG
jgi:hypothetical protein